MSKSAKKKSFTWPVHGLRKSVRETICKIEPSLIRFWPSPIKCKSFLFWRKVLKLRTVITKVQKSRARLTFNLSSSCYSLELTSSELLFEYHIRLLDIHQRMELALFHLISTWTLLFNIFLYTSWGKDWTVK